MLLNGNRCHAAYKSFKFFNSQTVLKSHTTTSAISIWEKFHIVFYISLMIDKASWHVHAKGPLHNSRARRHLLSYYGGS